MLGLRIVSALTGIPILLWVIYKGDLYLFIATLLLVLLGQRELYFLLLPGKLDFYKIAGYLATIATMTFFYWGKLLYLPHVYSLLLIILLVGEILRPGNTQINLHSITLAVFGVIYPGLLFSYVILLRQKGIIPPLMVFILTWSNDTFAYFVGRAFGKRPLSPTISPNKTWEGAVGGLGASVITAILFVKQLSWPLGHLVAFGFILGCTAQLGDLSESMLKRYANVKDSGRLIPGHGGILDRFDGITFSLPMAYLLWMIMG